MSDFYQQIAGVYPELFPVNLNALSLIKSLVPLKSEVLDVGCGPGDYTSVLYSCGYKVEGLDNSAKMISEARIKSEAGHYLMNMTEVANLQSQYRLIYSIGNCISYLNQFEFANFCQQLHDRLKPRGVVLLQTVNWELFFIKNTLNLPDKHLTDGRIFKRRYHKEDDETLRFYTSLVHGDQILNWDQVLFPKRAPLVEISLTENGFRQVDLYGDFLKSPFDPLQSPAMVWIAQRT